MKIIIFILISCWIGNGLTTDSSEKDVVDLRPFIERCNQLVDLDTILGVLETCDVGSHVSEYLHGEKFKRIHQYFWTEPEFLEIFQFIAASGYPEIYDKINGVYEFLGIPFRVGKNGPIIDDTIIPKSFPFSGRNKPQCDLPTISDAMRVVIPVEQWEQVLEDALENDTSVMALMKRIATSSKIKAVKKFMEMPEIKSLIAYLKTKDSRLEEVVSEIYE